MVKKIKGALKLPQNPPKEFTGDEIMQCLSTLSEKVCPTEITNGFETSKTLITAMKTLSTEKQSEFLVTILVDPSQAKSIVKQQNPQEAASQALPQKAIRDFLDEKGIKHFDFLKYFTDSHSKDYFYERDGHFNKLGHQRAGNFQSKRRRRFPLPPE